MSQLPSLLSFLKLLPFHPERRALPEVEESVLAGQSKNKVAIITFTIPYVGVILSEARSAESKDLNTEPDVSTSLRSAHDSTIS